MKILALDISMKNSGWAVFDNGKLTEYGVIPEPKYAGKSTDRYPKRSAKVGKLMAQALLEIFLVTTPDIIVIEEVSTTGKMGVKSIKGLCQTCGMILFLLDDYDFLDNVHLMAPSEWRKIVGLKKDGDWKISSVKKVNQIFKIGLTNTQHDSADAILLGRAQCSKE